MVTKSACYPIQIARDKTYDQLHSPKVDIITILRII